MKKPTPKLEPLSSTVKCEILSVPNTAKCKTQLILHNAKLRQMREEITKLEHSRNTWEAFYNQARNLEGQEVYNHHAGNPMTPDY